MPIPDAQQAVVTDAKVRDYRLNLEHPDGGSKAVWFQSLGYDRDEWRILAGDLLALARDCEKFETETVRFGVNTRRRA